jgi:hypothetical protein
MQGGEISGNSASMYGGGVFVNSGTFTMQGGEISGNSVTGYGGGVYVISGTFTKTSSGGVIYGSNASSTLKNTASSGAAVCVYVSSNSVKKRDATATASTALDSSKSGAAGGWE